MSNHNHTCPKHCVSEWNSATYLPRWAADLIEKDGTKRCKWKRNWKRGIDFTPQNEQDQRRKNKKPRT